MGPGFQGGWMNNVPVMMLVVVRMRGLVHGCEIVIMNKQAGSIR